MAIHIDIYAHLKKNQLIKEGDQLKRYVESLERDANKRLEKGAQGRSTKLIRLNDQQAKSYDQLINASDSFTKAKKREAAAEKELKRLQNLTVIKNQKKHTEALAAAQADLADATHDLTYRSQQLTAAANGQTRAMNDLNEENKAHTKNARQVGALLTANTTRFAKHAAATNQARREMESLHTANQAAVKDNAVVARGLQRVSEATERTSKERAKLNEMVKEGVTDYKRLREQSDRLKNAHKAENKAIGEVTGSVRDLSKQYGLHTRVVNANRDSLKGYAKQAAAAKSQIKDLYSANTQAIASNTKLARSFDGANQSIKVARRQHKEYQKLVRDGAGPDALRKKAEQVADAYARQAKDVQTASAALGDLLKGQAQSDAFIRSNRDSMGNYARSVADAQRQIEGLRQSHASQIRDSGTLSKSFNTAANAIKRATDTHAEYERLVSKGAGRDDLERQAKKVSDAYRQQRVDVSEATDALRRHAKEQRGKNIRGLTGGGGEYVSRNIAALTPLGRVNAGVGLPLLGMAANFGEAAVTASQSLALLPALATSAAAAVGTLAIGFHGFLDTVGDMGDPKKFAEGLMLLAPNAQQAAVEIKALVDGPLGDLKAMVQNNLFDGVAQQIHTLTGEFGPEMSNLFGGVATSMNKAFMGLTNQLMTPEAQASINTTIDNIVAGFDHMLPMLGPITSAFLTLTEVGSTFLPGLGDTFTKVATQFNNFIQQAAADGSLQNFIQKGIDAAGVLIGFVKDLGIQIYEVFGNKSPEDFRASLDAALQIVVGVGKAIQALGNIINAVLPYFDGVAQAMGGWEALLSTFIGIWAGTKLIGALDKVLLMLGGKGIAGALAKLPGVAEQSAGGVTTALGKIKIPPALAALTKLGGVAAILGGGAAAAGVGHEGVTPQKSGHVSWLPDAINPGVILNPENWIDNAMGKFDTPTAPDGTPGAPPPGAKGWVRPGLGAIPPNGWNTKPAPSSWSPHAIPSYTDPKDFQSTPGTFELSNIPVGQFGGAPWQVPGGVTDLPPDYDNIGKTGFYRSDPLKVMQEQGDMQAAQSKVEEERIKFLGLQADSTTKQDDLNKQRQNVIDAEQTWLQSVRDLKEAERGEFEDLTGQMDKMADGFKSSLGNFGDVIDKDFGISKGLPGIAENLFKFVATLAAAPLMGVGKAEQAKAGFPGGKGVGYGLIGMADAARGNYEFDYKGAADQTRAGYGINQYGLGTVGPNGLQQTVAPGQAAAGESPRDFAHRVMMPFFQSQGLTVGDHAADKYGEHQNGALDIMVPNIAKGFQVLQQVLGDPNVKGAIFNNKTYGYGHGLEPRDYSAGHTGDPSQDHTNHVHALYKPGASGNITPGGMPLPGGGRVPDWDMVAAAESGTRGVPGSARWNLPGGDRDSTGGLQIRQGTWNDFGGQDIAPSPWQATKEQQIAIAEKILAKQGPQAWAGGENFYWKNGAAAPGGVPPLAAEAGFAGSAGGLSGIPSGVVPVFVTNMGGGGMGGGFSGGAGGGGSAGDFAGPGGAPGVPGAAVPGGGSGSGGGAGGGNGGAGGGAIAGPHATPGWKLEATPGDPLRIGNLPQYGMPSHQGLYTNHPQAPWGIGGAAAGPQSRNDQFQAGFRSRARPYDPHLDPASALLPPAPPSNPALASFMGNGGAGGNGGGDPLSAFAPTTPWSAARILPGGLFGPGSVPGEGNAPNPFGTNLFAGQPSANATGNILGGFTGAATPGSGLFGNPLDTMNPFGAESFADREARLARLDEYARNREQVATRAQSFFPGALMPKPPGFAMGGEIPIVAHSGEHMLTAKDVDAMGGQAGVYDFRNALHYDTGGAIQFGGGASPIIPTKPKIEGLSVGSYTAPVNAPKPQAPQMPGIIEPPSAPTVPPPPAGMPGGAPITPPPGTPGAPGGPPLAAEVGYRPGDGEQTPVGIPTIGTPIGGQVDPDTGYGEGAKFNGGGIAGAAEAAAGAAGAAGGPAGAAGAAGIQTLMKLGERAIEFGAQASAIGVQGLMQTFLPSGGSELANNNWLTRIVGGIAGAAPAIANVAGGAGTKLGAGAGLPGVGPATPEQIAQQGLAGVGPPPAPAAGPVANTGVHIENYNTMDNRAASQDFGRYAIPGQR